MHDIHIPICISYQICMNIIYVHIFDTKFSSKSIQGFFWPSQKLKLYFIIIETRFQCKKLEDIVLIHFN